MIKKLETMAAAIGLAEGGDHDSALELLAELGTRYQGNRRKILTVAKDAPITAEPLEYAMGLASRLHYDTLFLNILSKRKAARELAAEHRQRFQDLFQDLAARLWPGRIPEIAHEHAVLCGDPRVLLREACRRIGGVALVIVQKRKLEPCVLDLHVPVFCFDTGPAARTSEVMTPLSGADPQGNGR